MEVPPPGVDEPAALCLVLPLPFRRNEVVRLDFQEPLEDERKTLRRGLLEGENLHVEVVHAQKASVALHVRFREVVVEEGIVLDPRGFDLQGREIQNLLQNAEDVLFPE